MASGWAGTGMCYRAERATAERVKGERGVVVVEEGRRRGVNGRRGSALLTLSGVPVHLASSQHSKRRAGTSLAEWATSDSFFCPFQCY